jgi:hypothetical protein
VVVVWRMGYFIPASQLCIAGRYDRPIIFPDVPREPPNSAVVSSIPKLPPRRAAPHQCLNTHCAAHFVQIAYGHSYSHHVIPLDRHRLSEAPLLTPSPPHPYLITFEYPDPRVPEAASHCRYLSSPSHSMSLRNCPVTHCQVSTPPSPVFGHCHSR